MILFPAVDIRGGRCVRLTKGRFDRETVYGDDPAAAAYTWEQAGAEYVHVVDLDGALAGEPKNREAIRTIRKQLSVPFQLGGGIRTLAAIENWLAEGVNRVILGSIAVRKPELVAEACKIYGDKIVVGIDARNGVVAVEGWGESGDLAAEELARRMTTVGVQRFIFTDIGRDGTLTGVNVAATEALAKACGAKVIASGGVSGLDDIRALKRAKGIEGVVIGKALYTGALSLPEALRIAGGEDAPC